MTNVRPLLAATAAAALLTFSSAAFAQANLPAAVGMFPQDSQVALAFNLESFDNDQSIMRYLLIDDVKQIFEEETGGFDSDEFRNPVDNAVEAAAKLVFHPANEGKFHTIAFASPTLDFDGDAAQAQNEDVFVAILGNFSGNDAAGLFETIGAEADGNSFTIPSNNRAITAVVPSDDVILISNVNSWLGQATTLSSDNSGLMAGGSGFSYAVSAMGGRMPDFIFYSGGGIFQKIVDEDPSSAMFLGPFVATRGLAFATFPGSTPTVELHAGFDNESSAQSGAAQLNGLKSMFAGPMLQSLPEQANTPEEREQAERVVRAFNSLSIRPMGTSTVIRYEANELPDIEEYREDYLNTIRQAIREGGMNFGGASAGLL